MNTALLACLGPGILIFGFAILVFLSIIAITAISVLSAGSPSLGLWIVGVLAVIITAAAVLNSVPSMIVAAIPWLFAATLWSFIRRNKRAIPNHPRCRWCQYNLTGNVSGICPECGKPIEIDPKFWIRWTGS